MLFCVKGDLLLKTYNMKKIFLWILIIFVLLMVIWVNTNYTDKMDKKLEARIENIENKDENVRDRINEFAESVKFSVCSNANYDNTEVWTTFVYNYKWKEYLWTAWHVVLKNPSKMFWGCWWNGLWSYPIDDSIKYNDNSDFIAFPYYWKLRAIDLPFCKQTEILGQSVWVIWYPSYTTESIEKMKEATQIINKGQISGYTTYAWNLKQPHLNYYVSNPLDTWSSWSPAILEGKDWLCLLWILTWWLKWDNTAQWIVQNIYNVVE